MQVHVSGKQVDVGDALRSRIVDELSQGIEKYFERGAINADVVVTKEGRSFRVDAVVNLSSGEQIVSTALGADAHAAFDGVLDRVEKRVRRYKRRLKDHHINIPPRAAETARLTILRSPEEIADEEFGEPGRLGEEPPSGVVIAETERPVKTMTVGMAVMELDLTDYPVVLFRNAAHGGLSVVYRRPDGNVGWIDPERTRSGNGHGSDL